MKIEDVIKAVSESQDNNSLINRAKGSEDNLSDFIVDTIQHNSDGGTDLSSDDLQNVEDDLAYAIYELTKARNAISNLK